MFDGHTVRSRGAKRSIDHGLGGGGVVGVGGVLISWSGIDLGTLKGGT